MREGGEIKGRGMKEIRRETGVGRGVTVGRGEKMK